jgi:hypothetical protein
LDLDVATALSALAGQRPVFHSERDFQHALAWQIQLTYPEAQIRLEPRPRRGIHLDLLVRMGQRCVAIELKYLVAALHATVGGELFDLPHQSENDISRHDVIKDITRIEALLADGYADEGCVVVLTNDRSYWQPSSRTDAIDAAFRLHEGRTLAGTLAWAARAGRGTTVRRDTPMHLTGRYACQWRDYSEAGLAKGQVARFRYLLITARSADAGSALIQDTTAEQAGQRDLSPVLARSAVPPTAGTARDEILATVQKLAGQSSDGTFTLMQVLTEMRRAGSRYAESTIRTHVTSRMCADAPIHHARTYDDLERLGNGRYRLQIPPAK